MAHLSRLLVSLGDIKPTGFSLSSFIIFLRIKGLDSCLYVYCQSNYASNSGNLYAFFPKQALTNIYLSELKLRKHTASVTWIELPKCSLIAVFL